MVAGDQVGIGGFNSINSGNKDVASLGGYGLMKGIQRKTHYDKDGKLIKRTTESSIDSMYMNDADFQKKYKINKQQFNNLQSKGVGDNTKVAMTEDERERRKVLNSIINTPGYDPRTVTEAQRQLQRLNQGLTPFTDRVDAKGNKIYSDTNTNTLGAKDGSLIAMANTDNRGITTAAPETKVSETRMAGGFFSPQNFQRSGVPDATIMTREQMGQALTGDPGYTRFGSLDRPGTQAAKDTAAFNQRVKSDFFSPVKADARSIAERREANVQSMRDEARERDTQFRETGQQTFGGRVGERRSGDDTYGTNVMSNPAFGFRSKMSDENKARYDASATEATRRAEVEPSKGNLVMSVANMMKRGFNTAIGASEGTPLTREVALEKRGEAEQRRYEKYLNRPTYQREATARVEAGITPQMTKEKNQAQIRADAAARDAAFQANKRAATVERVARRTPENTGTGRDGTFGAGTTGRGMPSNPQGVRQQGVGVSANNLSRHSPGTSKDQPNAKRQQAVKKAQTQKKQSGGGFGGGVGNPTNRRGSGVSNRSNATKKSAPSTKKSSTSTSTSTNKRAQAAAKRRASQSKAKAAKKSKSKSSTSKSSKSKSSKSSSPGSARGKAAARGRTRRGRRGRRCDIRCKYNIMLLTNMNLVKDDLAEVAYFVKELQA